MADDRKDERKQSGKKDRERGSSPPINLRDPVFGPLELQPDGTYQIGFSSNLYWGNKPAWAQIHWRPKVNGMSVSGVGFQIVSRGKIEYRFNLKGERASIAVDLQVGDWSWTEPLKEIELPKPKRKLEVLGTARQPDGFMVVLRRVGKDGKKEAGPISFWDFVEQEKGLVWMPLTSQMEPDQEMALILLPLHDQPRKVTFFLPDDDEVKTNPVDVSAKPSEKVIEAEVVGPSAGQRITEAFQRGRRGELFAAKDPSKVLPLAVVAGSILATILAFRGPEGPGGK